MSKRLFDAPSRARYARENPNTPTGIIFPWKGLDFSIMPVTYGDLVDVTSIVDTGAELLNGLKNAQNVARESQMDTVTEVIKYIAGKAPQLIFRVRDHLAKSPGVCDSGTERENAEDRKRFDEWFLEQDAVGMMRAFVPKLKEVIGARPLAIQTPEKSEPAPSSEEMTLKIST